MPIGMKDIVLFGKETTRGTAAGTMPLHHPFLGNGLEPTLTQHHGEILPSSAWPYVGDQVPLGATAALQFTPAININTIRDILLMAKRTAGLLPSLTIAHTKSGVGDGRFLGCVCNQLELNFSRSGSPDASSVLQGTMGFGCMKPESTTGLSAGTQATGHKFQIRHTTFTINSVAATKVTAMRIAVTNELDEGAPDADNLRLWLNEGMQGFEVTLTAYFVAAAWHDLVLNATEHTASIVLGTGTANETVTGTINKVRASTHQLNKGQTSVLQEITLLPFHDGTNPSIDWTFGTAIGASALGLS